MGLTKEVLVEGNGPTPTKGASVTVHCTGYGKDRDLQQKFWSTKDPGQTPFTFNVGLGQVIKGWDEGVLGMKLGEQARLTCTPDYAYGAGGFPAWGYLFPPISYMDLGFRCTIQPNSTLIFEIEVLKIE
ncbi:hypothetical protein JG688_00005907 [Phytophthora aleatoria]|uniref:peptidylprolyl isomerase n=1 Tax=Phytophthora aleatoria TaxID=2496075 RepID=A0A8J5J084_9STRA|nr:hypothetical protein JG688_00005907 [Phytophthora aleatoria]